MKQGVMLWSMAIDLVVSLFTVSQALSELEDGHLLEQTNTISHF